MPSKKWPAGSTPSIVCKQRQKLAFVCSRGNLPIYVLRIHSHCVFPFEQPACFLIRHFREGGKPGSVKTIWVPACAGMTNLSQI